MIQNSVELRKFFTPENFSLIITGSLAFFVLSSKHIFIYNEETLVLISFIGFVLFSYRMLSESIENSFNERSTAIFTELQNSIQLKENLIKELLEEHKKQLSLNTFLHSLNMFSNNELSLISTQRQKTLQLVFSQQVHQKLKSLFLSQNATQERLQNALKNGFRASVLEEFNFSKKTMKPKLIQQALQQLKTHNL